MDVTDLRAAERFLVAEPLRANFGSATVALVNISAMGVQIEHSNQLRLGSTGRLWFRHDDVAVSVDGIIVWSHLSQKPDASGRLLYHSGVRLNHSNPEYALALNQLFQRKALKRDEDSLNRKRQRLLEREMERKKSHSILRPFPPA